jgi:hypothetical protein
VSKVKSPEEKKRLSYERDRRNVYGENSKSSRKNIRRGKQRTHQDERRSVRQSLATPKVTDEAAGDEAEARSAIRSRFARLKGFHKHPDRPLGEVVGDKLIRRARQNPSSR